MKQQILIFLIFASTLTVFGQNERGTLGVEVGPNFTYLKRNSIDKNSNHPIFCFSSGLTFNYNISKMFSIGTGAAFEQKGNISDYYHIDLATSFPPFFYDEWRDLDHLNYLTTPILLRTTFGKKIAFYFNTGCFMSYLLNAKTIKQSKYYPEETSDGTIYYKRFDYGVSIGIGISIPIKNKIKICIETRNNIGLHDIQKNNSYSSYEKLKTNSVNLLFGIKYIFKDKD